MIAPYLANNLYLDIIHISKLFLTKRLLRENYKGHNMPI